MLNYLKILPVDEFPISVFAPRNSIWTSDCQPDHILIKPDFYFTTPDCLTNLLGKLIKKLDIFGNTSLPLCFLGNTTRQEQNYYQSDRPKYFHDTTSPSSINKSSPQYYLNEPKLEIF